MAVGVKNGAGIERMVLCHHSMASLDAASRGYEILLEEGHLIAGLNHFWPGNAIRVKTLRRVRRDEWIHVAVTYDGSSRADGLQVYLDGVLAEVDVVRDNLYNTIRYEDKTPPPLMLGARFRDPGFKDGVIDEFQVSHTRLTSP